MKHGVHPYFVMRGAIAPRAGGAGAPWSVPDLCAAYQWPSKLEGGGVIAIVELAGGWIQSDVDQYFQAVNLPAPHITDVSVDGTNNSGGTIQSDADAEVALDIQVAAAAYAVATGKAATIRVYWSQDITSAIQRATADGCDVCSISWGADEAQWGLPAADALEQAAADATAAGMIVFAASGDNDSSDGGPGRSNVDLPAAAPHVVGCGGTKKTRNDETVWNDNPGNTNGEGSGGGFSRFFKPMPPWQANAPHGPGRMVPDMAANADPNTGYEIIIRGSQEVVGGTSAVAPLYSGLFAALGKKMGFATPELYLHNTCFNDITVGDNGAFRASAGPDPCTGLGSPIGERLAALLTSPQATASRQLRAAQAEIAELQAEIAGIQAGVGSTGATVRARAGLQSHLAAKAMIRPAAAPTGCCTISRPGVPDQSMSGITQAACRAIADLIEDAAAHWVQGVCAE
jgi:kumamolisin